MLWIQCIKMEAGLQVLVMGRGGRTPYEICVQRLCWKYSLLWNSWFTGSGDLLLLCCTCVRCQGKSSSIALCRQLLGVLGVDAVLDDMEAALLDEQFGLSYAFLIDVGGRAIIHPRLKPSADVSSRSWASFLFGCACFWFVYYVCMHNVH